MADNSKKWDKDEVRELIRLVKPNSDLYAKNSNVYKNKQAKVMAWTTVGQVLKPPCSDEETMKKFKTLRDAFNKANKKAHTYIPSGSGATPSYVPNYEFYADLQFLSEHIQGRTTSSNISQPVASDVDTTSNVQHAVPLGSPITPETIQIISLEDGPVTMEALGNALKQFQSNSNGTSSSSSCDQFDSIVELCTVENGQLDMTEDTTVTSPYQGNTPQGNTETQGDTIVNPTPASSVIAPHSSLSIRGKAVRSIMSNKGLITPPPDKTSKKKDDNQSAELSKLMKIAEDMSTAISKKAASQPVAQDDSLAMIKFGMERVGADKKVKCMIDILRVIQIYSEGGSVDIIEKI